MIKSAPPTTPYANVALSAHAHVGAHPVSGLKKIVNGDAVVTSGTGRRWCRNINCASVKDNYCCKQNEEWIYYHYISYDNKRVNRFSKRKEDTVKKNTKSTLIFRRLEYNSAIIRLSLILLNVHWTFGDVILLHLHLDLWAVLRLRL